MEWLDGNDEGRVRVEARKKRARTSMKTDPADAEMPSDAASGTPSLVETSRGVDWKRSWGQELEDLKRLLADPGDDESGAGEVIGT